jgi:hypothetical protein
LGLGLDLIGLDDHDSLVHHAGLVLVHRERRLASGEAGRDPLGLDLFPLGLGFLRVVKRRVVIDQPGDRVRIGRPGAEHGQLDLGRLSQEGPSPLALRGDQLLALLMHNVDDRTGAQQILVTGVLTDVGPALPRRLIAHLIADRIAEIVGDHELVGRVPGDRRGHLHLRIMVVEDSRPLDFDLAGEGLEGEGSCAASLETGPGFAVPLLEDQFVIGLLDEDLEEPPLEFEAGLMDVGLDLVGEMLVLERHGQGHLQ